MTNKYTQFVIVTILMLLSTLVRGQEHRRIELPVPSGSNAYHTVPLDSKGVILISKPDRKSYSVQKFSTDLVKEWDLTGDIQNGLDFVSSSYDGQSVFLLFSKFKSSDYQIVKVNVGPGFVENFMFNTIDRFEITDFKTVGYASFMAGTLRDQPVLIYTNLSTGQSKVLPSTIKGTNSIQSLELDPVNGLVTVSFAIKKNRSMTLMHRVYNEQGQLMDEILLEPEPHLALLNGKLQRMDNGVNLVIGTYGYAKMQSASNAASQGLYIARIVQGELEYIRYYSFTDFANFFNFMSDRQQEKMERRIAKNKEEGKDVKLNYRLLVHDIIATNNQYLLVAEAFYPEYRYNNNTGMYGGSSYFRNSLIYGPAFGYGLYNPFLWNPYMGARGMYGTGQVFDGFVYTHGIVAGIDFNGKLLWDNSINFDRVKSPQLKEMVSVQLGSSGQVQLAYSNKGAITSKVIRGGRVLDDEKRTTIPTALEGDKVKSTETESITYWYDNFYLAWGEQKIVNAQSGDTNMRGKRNVFYLNKIGF